MQTQRRFATGVKVYENSDLADLVEEALSVSDSALSAETDPIIQRRLVGPECASLCRYKVLEILVCLVNNARQALARARPAQPLLTLEVRMSRAEWLTLHVQDNGVGIAPENLARIFAQNAKEGASAFGLHDAANAAKELGGSLRAHSAGLGLGAIFELELPYHPVRAELTRAA